MDRIRDSNDLVRELHGNFVTVSGGTMSFAFQAIVFIICQI